MTTQAVDIPAADAILCESCGYTLSGLPPDGNCPECGAPIADTLESGRGPSAWERAAAPRDRLGAFASTTAAVIFRPGRFYRTLAVRLAAGPARSFAHLHWALAGVLFGLCAWVHMNWYTSASVRAEPMTWAELPGLMILAYAFVSGVTWAAARLTAWEAAYRGYRLPRPVVARGLYYHAAHLLPVALVALFTVLGWQAMLRGRPDALRYAMLYLYVLSGEVVLCAGYLFNTYWIGMRNMMYANR